MESVRDERGIGLVDVLVAMMLLAILAVSIVPAIALDMRVSSNNVDYATASQIVDRELDKAQVDVPKTCAALQSLVGDVIGNSEPDPRGTILTIERTLGSCPSVYPGVVNYTVTVSNQSGASLSSATATIQLTSAS